MLSISNAKYLIDEHLKCEIFEMENISVFWNSLLYVMFPNFICMLCFHLDLGTVPTYISL